MTEHEQKELGKTLWAIADQGMAVPPLNSVCVRGKLKTSRQKKMTYCK